MAIWWHKWLQSKKVKQEEQNQTPFPPFKQDPTTENPTKNKDQNTIHCTVRYGVYQALNMPVHKGTTVKEIRNHLHHWNIPSSALAYSGTSFIDEDFALPDGIVVEFHRALPGISIPSRKQIVHNEDLKFNKISATEPLKTQMGYVYGLRMCKLRPVYHIPKAEFYNPDKPPPTLKPQRRFTVQGLWGTTWKTPEMTATCDAGGFRLVDPSMDTPPPHNNPCRCGINMYKIGYETMSALTISVKSAMASPTPRILFLTRGWGKVAIHEDGYRIQEAEVLASYIPREWKIKENCIAGFEKVPMYNDIPDFCRLLENYQDKEPITIPEQEAL